MCDCFSKAAEGVKKWAESSGEPMVGEPEFSNTGCKLVDDGGAVFITYTEVSYTALKTLKNGKTKECKKKASLVHEYCPFCGEKYVPDDKE